jgi:pimeloyl-ACP methyl ester carboxylesterase
MQNFKCHNYDVFYKTSGNPDNPCIVCLHPAFGDHQTFDDQLDTLSESYFLITLDMLGHGLTQLASTPDQIDATIEHIRAILDQYQIKACHLLGVSLGSLIAQGFAKKYPQYTLSVTVVGGYSIHKNNQSLKKAQNREIFSWLFLLIFNMNGFRKYIAKRSTYQPQTYQKFLKSTQAFTRKSIVYLQGMGKLFEDSSDPVPYPLLLVYGDHDLPIALEHGKEWVQQEPKAEIKIINEAGHCANMEQPQKFNQVYLQFLKNLDLPFNG